MTTSLTFNAVVVIALVATALALVFEYLPWLNEAYGNLNDDVQRLIMLGLIAAGTVALLVNDCRTDSLCYSANWQSAAIIFFEAIAVNQSVHRLLPRYETFGANFTPGPQ